MPTCRVARGRVLKVCHRRQFGETHLSEGMKVLAMLVSVCLVSCSTSIGPYMVPRDRVEYVDAIGYSWEQQTLLNLVKIRYGHAPIFLSINQVVTGYQIQNTIGGGFAASNFSGAPGMLALGGTATAQGQYTDRPTVIYAPLTGVDFLQKLMTPIPPDTVLFLLQSGYDAEIVMPLVLDSINGVNNGTSIVIGLSRLPDPEFARLVHLIRDLQLTRAVQVQIDRPKKGNETSLMTFPPGRDLQARAESQTVRSILGLSPNLQRFNVYYGGWSGKDNEIAMMTRSMFQVMLELAAGVQVPQADSAGGEVAPELSDEQAAGTRSIPTVNILSGNQSPSNASVAIQYNHSWFWIPNGDFRSKAVFESVMLLFSISDVGTKGSAPIVTIPANG